MSEIEIGQVRKWKEPLSEFQDNGNLFVIKNIVEVNRVVHITSYVDILYPNGHTENWSDTYILAFSEVA